jgi:hypothetical protein
MDMGQEGWYSKMMKAGNLSHSRPSVRGTRWRRKGDVSRRGPGRFYIEEAVKCFVKSPRGLFLEGTPFMASMDGNLCDFIVRVKPWLGEKRSFDNPAIMFIDFKKIDHDL